MNRYEDIIELPHHVSPTRPRMSLHDRAAQFSPFAALTGHAEAVAETARLTEPEMLLDETEIRTINEQLRYLQQHLSENPVAEITYYIPDERKTGGRYARIRSAVRKIDGFSRTVIMSEGTTIPMEHISHIRFHGGGCPDRIRENDPG